MTSLSEAGHGELLSKLDLFAFLPDSSFGSSIYNQGSLSSISPQGVKGDLIFPTRNTRFSGVILSITVRSRDANPDGTPVRQAVREKRLWSINRSHQSLGYSLLIRGWSVCLFFWQTGATVQHCFQKSTRRESGSPYQIPSDNL